MFDAEFSLTLEQQAAVDAMRAHIDANAKNPFVLAGYAGTGKTTAVTQALNSQIGICYTAPTHKAVGVLAARGMGAGCEYRTIHSLLGCRAQRKNGERVFQPDWHKSSWAEFDVIVLDEASMVGVTIWSWIVEAQKQWPRVLICMGDPCQLPPVKDGDESPAFQHTSAQLTEVMRHAGPILELATRVRNNLTAPKPVEVIDDGPVRVVGRQEFLESIVAQILHGEDVKVLAWTNCAVDWLNREIRNRVFDDPPETWQAGEHIVVKSSWSSPDEQVLLHSERDLWLAEDVELQKVHGIPAWRIRVDGINRDLWRVAPGAERAYRKKLAKLKHEARANSAWRAYYDFQDAFVDLRLGYATTVHKSQGSTYAHCYVVDSNLKQCHETRTRNMLRYVAFSRASETLTVS